MRITVNAADNTLRFRFHPRETVAVAHHHGLPTIIDIGERGRLLGVEVDISSAEDPAFAWRPGLETDEAAVALDPAAGTLSITVEPVVGDLARVAITTATVVTNGNGAITELIVPRQGNGYEITYPSGNR